MSVQLSAAVAASTARGATLPRPDHFVEGLAVAERGPWFYGGSAPAARQGWKVYVSFTPYAANVVIERLVPLLARHHVHFKYLRRVGDVYRLNAGALGYSQIGKCLVCYLPGENRRFIEELSDAVSGLPGRGPAVPYCRPLHAGLALYYRFGSYDGGALVVNGVERADSRDDYDAAVPPGVADWLAPLSTPPATSAKMRSFLLRYPTHTALRQQGKSGVFLALNVSSESFEEVVLKLAYPRGAVQPDGSDGRSFLRNEIRIYCALAAQGVQGVAPRAIDSYDDGDRVALVLERIPGEDLLTLKLKGELTRSDLEGAWQQIATLHRHGMVIGDAKLANCLRDPRGAIRIVDFESARVAGAAPGEVPRLRTFALQDAPEVDGPTWDRLHFLTSVVWEYAAVEGSDEPNREVVLHELARRSPRSDAEAWALDRLQSCL
ncbi:class III lanthionine synthetase LanKC N-terminal domain-containing protein [Blastococcus sp. SYSU DS0541]